MDDIAINTDYSHSYTYNTLNRMTAATLAGSAYTFTHYDNDDLNVITYPNGVTGTHTYESNGPIASIAYAKADTTALETLGYSYDDVNNITSYSDTDGGYVFGYDRSLGSE